MSIAHKGGRCAVAWMSSQVVVSSDGLQELVLNCLQEGTLFAVLDFHCTSAL